MAKIHVIDLESIMFKPLTRKLAKNCKPIMNEDLIVTDELPGKPEYHNILEECI
jgi:hypothetical protein